MTGLQSPVQVVNHAQHPAYLLYHLLQEGWKRQEEVQPGVDHAMPVEGGLRQSEPAAGVLGPKW